MTPVTRRTLLSGVSTAALTLSGGCLGSMVEDQDVNPENLNHNAGIKRVDRTDSGLRIEVNADAYFSCKHSSLPEGAVLRIIVRADGEAVHRDTWDVQFTGCMHESRTGRVYNLDIRDYTSLVVDTELKELRDDSP